MKILHVAETIVGGIASHLSELLPLQVAALGHGNVTVLVPVADLSHIAPIDGANIIGFDHNGTRVMATRALADVTRHHVRKSRPDIIHAHSSFAGIACRMPGLKSAASPPIVYCPHGWSFAQDVPPFKKRVFALIERVLLSNTGAVINVSKHERDLAVSMGLPSDKLLVVRNGIATETAMVSDDGAEPTPTLGPYKIHLLFIGRLDRQKGVDLLFEAASVLKDSPVHFHIVGSKVRGDEADASVDLPNVTMYGWRTRNFVQALLPKVDALIMPSRWEGMPMTGLEAMRAAKAIIASNKSALPELVEDGVTGILVDIDRPNALAEAILKIEKPKLRALGQAGRERFLRDFTIDRQNSELLEIYRNLTEQSTRALNA